VRSLVLISFLAIAYALLRGWPEDAAPLLRACAAVLVLVAGLGLWGRPSGPVGGRAASRRRPRALDFLTMAALVLAIECLFLLLIVSAPEPAAELAYRAHVAIAPEGETATRHRIEAATAVPSGGNWLWTRETRRDLPRRSDFKPGNKPELFLRLENPADAKALIAARPYVSAFSLGSYRNAGWSQVAGPVVELVPGPDGLIHFPDRPGPGIRHQVFHGYSRDGSNPFTALQGAVSTRLPALTQLADGLAILPPPVKDPDGYQYTAVSKSIRLDDLAATAEVHSGSGMPAALLALPSDPALRTALTRMAADAAGNGPLLKRLLNIQNQLRTTIDYSLAISNPDNRDPVDNFLFHERRGHCEMFATSAALLARALGVPARVTYGWAGGSYLEAQNLFVFRAFEAHAWTEVWLEPYGWVILDATPPAAIAARPPANLAELDKPAPLEDPAEVVNPAVNRASLAQQPQRAALLLSGIFLPSTLLLVAMRFRRTRHERAHGGRRESRKPPGYLQAFRTASARHGLPVPPGRTLRQHIARLRELGQAPRFAAALLDYHYRTCYGDGTADPGEEGMLLREIRSWEAVAANRASMGGRASTRR
jgi:transglutaminase-like putative cysteine protease